MKRISVFVALTLSVILPVTLLTTNRVVGDNHIGHQKQELKPSIDGAITPDAIPTHAAEAMVYRILSSDEPDRLGDRKKAYLTVYGFNEDAQASIMLAAREFKQLVSPIDQEASDIKDRIASSSDNAMRERLTELQRGRVDAIVTVEKELRGRLQRYRSLEKWESHLKNIVKRKTKGFAVEMPKRKVGLLNRLTSPFTVQAQMGGCGDPLLVYTDVVYYSYSKVVYGYSSSDAGANNCGHNYTPTTYLTHSMAPSAQGYDYAAINLDSGQDYYYDGNFFANTSIEGYCPVAVMTFPAGTNNDSSAVVPFVRIQTASLPGTISSGENPNLTYRVTGSYSVNGGSGMLDIVAIDVSNLQETSVPSPAQISYTVNGGASNRPLGQIHLKGGFTSGSMKVQVSFANCTGPGNAVPDQNVCYKDTNAMTVNSNP